MNPTAIRIDQDPEFTGLALDQWTQVNGVSQILIQPEKPAHTASIESFNGKMTPAAFAAHLRERGLFDENQLSDMLATTDSTK